MNFRHFVIGLAAIVGTGSAIGCSAATTDEDAVGSADYALSAVTWTSVVGVTATDNAIQRTAASSGWNAGAVSNETLAGNGYVEFSTAEANTAKMAGLSNGNTDQGYQDIDFAFYLTNQGTVNIYEGGAYRGAYGSYVAGDLFRVEVNDGVVRYLRNGQVLAVSSQTPVSPLLVDTSVYSTSATLTGVVVADITFWQNAVGVTQGASSLTKTAATGWGNSGASTMTTVPVSGGYVEFSTAENNTAKFAGLSSADPDLQYSTIGYALYLRNDGVLGIYEQGASRGSFGTYVAGDVFRVLVTNGTVTYLRNGVSLYTSGVAASAPLLFDSALYTTGATITNLTMVGSALWHDGWSGVSVTGNNLTKIDSAGWKSGAYTQTSFTGNGYCEFSTAEANTAKMAGLSVGNTDHGYIDIDFGLYMRLDGTVAIYEMGRSRGVYGTYVAGDVFRVAASSGQVTYYRNGTPLYVSSASPTGTLLCDTSLYSPGATITNLSIQASAGGPSFWTSGIGVSESGTTITKTGAAGWNAGAASATNFSGNGYVEFTTNEANTAKMAGLSNGNTDQNYTDVDFGIYLLATGSVAVYESGLARSVAPPVTYVAGDVFRIESSNNIVTYYKNGSPFYVSLVSPVSPLLLDTSLFTTGSTIAGATLVDVAGP